LKLYAINTVTYLTHVTYQTSMQAHGQEEMFMGFAADAPRWTQQPSSDFPSTRDSVQKQVMLNAL